MRERERNEAKMRGEEERWNEDHWGGKTTEKKRNVDLLAHQRTLNMAMN